MVGEEESFRTLCPRPPQKSIGEQMKTFKNIIGECYFVILGISQKRIIFFNFFPLNHMENGNKNSSTEAILKVHILGEVPSKAWKSMLSKYLISIS